MQYSDLSRSFHMHQKNATFDIKIEKFATSDKTRRSSIPCKESLGEDDRNDDEFDEEFSQNHEFRGAPKRLRMHYKKHSNDNASISQFQLRPAPHWADPRQFAFFFSWMANSRGRGHLTCQMPGGGDERRGKCPAIRNESNAAGCETRQFMHAQSSRSCYIRV